MLLTSGVSAGTSSTIRSSRKRRLECEGTEEGETEDEASPSIFKRPRQSMDEGQPMVTKAKLLIHPVCILFQWRKRLKCHPGFFIALQKMVKYTFSSENQDIAKCKDYCS